MTTRTKLILWVIGIMVLFGAIVIIWAIDTGRIGIFADSERDTIKSAQELKQLPSPDQSTFSKIFTSIANLFK